MKRISVDLSDTFDGYSQNSATFSQYQLAMVNLSNRGRRRFKLDKWMHELHAGGPDGRLVGVGMRVIIDPALVNTMIAPPLFGPDHHRAPITSQQIERDYQSLDVLQKYREAGYLPVRYEIEKPVENPTESLERLEAVLALGTWVSQFTMVPSYPRSARTASIFLDPPMDRTMGQIDALFEKELVQDVITPLDMTPDPDQEIKNT